MTKIDIYEVHKLLLKIAKEFDLICTKHNIPYYMLGGTMLGAIRHRGFIPWDDDMDFGVPLEFYEKLIEHLETELPDRYRCSTYKNSESVQYPFVKIEDTYTCIDDPRVNIPLEKKIGVNVDVFPLVFAQKDDPKINKVLKLLRINTIANVESTRGGRIRHFTKTFLRWFVPNKKVLCDKMMDIIQTIEPGDYLNNIFGRWHQREFVPAEWYGVNCKYFFDGLEFNGFRQYDNYLVHMYGDYMKLPPKEQQQVHCDNIYLKDMEN